MRQIPRTPKHARAGFQTADSESALRDQILIALTDRALSPIATDARHVFVVAARGVGPFDSHTATMALVHALTAGVAARLRRSATARLDAIEQAWSAGNELIDA